MFFALALTSMMGYALQNALLVKYARSMDGFSLSFYRNISFSISLLPLLLLSSPDAAMEVLSQWNVLLLAGLGGGMALILRFASYNFIPIGVSHSFTTVLVTIFLTAMGWVIFQEHLDGYTLLIIGFLLIGILWLALQRNHMPHINNRTLEGIGLASLAAVPLSYSVFLFLHLSKTIDPYASSYFWEVSIAIGTVLLMIGRWVITGRNIERISIKQFLRIAAASSPTLLGTAGIAMAVRLGPVGVVSAINNTSLVVTALLAWWWYDEKLKNAQWYAIVLIVIGMACLKLVQ